MLWDAIRKNNYRNVKVILEANFPVNNPLDSTGMTALHFAAGHGNLEILQILLQEGAEINFKDINGRSPLHLAASSGNMDAINLLLVCPGIEIDAKSSGNDTPLMKAILFG